MDTSKLVTIVSLIIALSVASERLVEIVKGLSSYLSEKKTNDTEEGRRHSALQALAVVAAVGTAFLARPVIPQEVLPVTNNFFSTLALGFLASGGSGFWNSVLTYVTNVKDLNDELAKAKKLENRALETSLAASMAKVP